MHIHQLSVRYLTHQDRILISISTRDHQELALWLTRRMALGLWPLLNQVVLDHFAVAGNAKTDGFVDLATLGNATKQVLAEQRHQEVMQSADFATPYGAQAQAQAQGQPKPMTKPLGEQPVLVTDIKLTPNGAQALHIKWTEQLPGLVTRICDMELQATMVYALLQLMAQALQASGWALETPALQGLMAVRPAGQAPAAPDAHAGIQAANVLPIAGLCAALQPASLPTEPQTYPASDDTEPLSTLVKPKYLN